MNWFAKLRTTLGHDQQHAGFQKTEDHEVKAAFYKASAALGEARARREEVRRVTSSLVQIREKNHFGESIELAMQPRNNRSRR